MPVPSEIPAVLPPGHSSVCPSPLEITTIQIFMIIIFLCTVLPVMYVSLNNLILLVFEVDISGIISIPYMEYMWSKYVCFYMYCFVWLALFPQYYL